MKILNYIYIFNFNHSKQVMYIKQRIIHDKIFKEKMTKDNALDNFILIQKIF